MSIYDPTGDDALDNAGWESAGFPSMTQNEQFEEFKRAVESQLANQRDVIRRMLNMMNHPLTDAPDLPAWDSVKSEAEQLLTKGQ